MPSTDSAHWIVVFADKFNTTELCESREEAIRSILRDAGDDDNPNVPDVVAADYAYTLVTNGPGHAERIDMTAEAERYAREEAQTIAAEARANAQNVSDYWRSVA